MIDYEKIGRRILEERKNLRKISQEKMAEDLLMYQADVSNMERGKPGSGIDNLDKLDKIAEYFGIPLENLIFGMPASSIAPYSKNKNEITEVTAKKPVKKEHKETLKKVTDCKSDDELRRAVNAVYTAGRYTVYVLYEHQEEFRTHFYLDKCHLYTFYKSELIANLVASYTAVQQYLTASGLNALGNVIQYDILDVTDVLRFFNPYVPLVTFETDPESRTNYGAECCRRYKALRAFGNEPVLLIESVYVSEDYRRQNVCRLMLDVLSILFGDYTGWLNLEPTAGEDLKTAYAYVPSYSVSEVGQINLNAAIAEKLGFHVNPDIWHRKAEVVDADGNRTVKTIEIRKTAYRFSGPISELTKSDRNLAEIGYAKQKVAQNQTNTCEAEDGSNSENADTEANEICDVYVHGFGNCTVTEFSIIDDDGQKLYFYACTDKTTSRSHYCVSKQSAIAHELNVVNIEEYEDPIDMLQSDYVEQLVLLHSLNFAKAENPSDHENIENEL